MNEPSHRKSGSEQQGNVVSGPAAVNDSLIEIPPSAAQTPFEKETQPVHAPVRETGYRQTKNAPQHARPRTRNRPGSTGMHTRATERDVQRQSAARRTNGQPPIRTGRSPNGASDDMPLRKSADPRRKKRRKAPGGGLFVSCVVVAILTISAGITALIEAPERRAIAESLAAQSAAMEAEKNEADQAAGEIPYGPLLPDENASYTQPSANLVALPADGRVDMKYFDDALFIGDSLTRGFQEYQSGIENAKYAAYIGVGPKQFMEGLVENIKGEKVSAMDEIRAAQAKKVYILLGTNSMATLTDEAFLKYYTDFIRYLIEELPKDTVYYLQGIPPVTAEKFESDANFSQERIKNLNESIAKIAYENDLNYLDLYSALADENGNLREDIASGSIHLNDRGYNVWREYLVTHTAYSPDNPYLPGSPRYIRPEA